jgi:uncharacterized protein YidB (DUF937 family)
MGLLDQVVGSMGARSRQPQRRGSVGQTVAAGVALALLIKAIRQHQASQAAGAASQAPQAQTPEGQRQAGGLLGGLGDMFGGAGGGLGGILGNLGGAGALGGLIGQLQQKGLGDKVNSWVSTGANQPVAPQELEQALGDEALEELQQQTGMPRQQLVSELARELPEAVNEATPQGRVPADDEELQQIATQPPVAH